MIFYLIRHGANDSLGNFLPGQRPGVHLNEQGKEQARLVALSMKHIKLDAIYASPLERTMETAAPLAEMTGLPVKMVPGLIEMDTGEFTGVPFNTLNENPHWKKIRENPSQNSFPNGESFTSAWDRLWKTLHEIITSHKVGDRVVVFSHSDCIKMLITRAMGIPFEHFQRVIVDPASLSILVYYKEKFWLTGSNIQLPYQLPVIEIKKPVETASTPPVD